MKAERLINCLIKCKLYRHTLPFKSPVNLTISTIAKTRATTSNDNLSFSRKTVLLVRSG